MTLKLGFGFSLMVIVLAQGQHLSPTFIGMLFAIGGVNKVFFAMVLLALAILASINASIRMHLH